MCGLSRGAAFAFCHLTLPTKTLTRFDYSAESLCKNILICTNKPAPVWHHRHNCKRLKWQLNLVFNVPLWGLGLLCPAAVPLAGNKEWWLYWCPPGGSPGYSASTRTEDPSPHTAQIAPAGMFALGLGARETAQGDGRKRVKERRI